MDINPAAQAFAAAVSRLVAKGYQGRELYEQLAADDELPASFDTEEAAAIQGITADSLKKQRHRGVGPSFIRLPKAVRYPRPDLCQYLASRYVRRGT